MKKLAATLIFCLSAFVVTGCTTSSSTLEAPTTAFASPTDPVNAPVPATRPDSVEAKASLAAEVEANTDEAVTAVAFAPDSGTTVPIPEENAASKTVNDKAIPQEAVEVATAKASNEAPVKNSSRERDCLMRAMYFESNRSSRDGQLAVGTVVMHRLAAGNWGTKVCSVVGSPRQFAPGVLTRRMQGDTSDLAALADAILAGKRHPGVAKNVLFFHTAGLKFPYKNMRYVLVAGGNTFYYKARRRG
jgi:spore germination cell wall hydrolase CwlJ-like protein